MPSNFERLGTAREVRRAHQLAFSVHMLSDIAAQFDAVADRGDMLCGYCMIDSVYVNIRLLSEFLTRGTSGKTSDRQPSLLVGTCRPRRRPSASARLGMLPAPTSYT